MKCASAISVTLLMFSAACFAPNVTESGDEGGGGGDDSGGETAGPTGPTAGATMSSSSGDEAEVDGGGADPDTTSAPETEGADSEPGAPSVALTINGSAEPDPVNRASALVIEAAVDGDAASVTILLDGDEVELQLDEAGGIYRGEWIASGAEVNGDRTFEAVAVDADGLEGSAAVDVTLDLPDGGLIEGWTYDNGEGGSVLGIAPNPEGDQVVWSGQVFVGDNQVMRVDRIVGDPWQGNGSRNDDQGGDVRWLDSGNYVVASAVGDAFDLNTRLRRYSTGGDPIDDGAFDGSDNDESNWPLGLEVDANGDYYILGAFVGPTAFSSYLLKANANYTQEWKRNLTEAASTDGAPFVYDFDVRDDGQIAVVGAHAETEYLWLAVYSPSGELEDQLSLPSEFDASIGFDVTWDPAGGLVVAGSADTGSGWGRLVRKYDDALLEQWTVDGPGNNDFALAVTADEHGHIAAVFAENCNLTEVFGYSDCRLVVRSYDTQGAMRWQHVAEGDASEFTGPLLFRPGSKADIEVDRYGYIYVTALHDRPLGGGETRGEWWAEQHHP